MYDWLAKALQDSGIVVTANRRLARQLRAEYNEQQRNSGSLAWDTPAVMSWDDWLAYVRENANQPAALATRINSHQSQWIWESCWRREFDDDARILNLVRHSRDAWQRMADWQIPISDVARHARTEEEHYFARVAGRYLAHLERHGQIDDAGSAAEALQLISSKATARLAPVTFAGFDRKRPVMSSTVAALQSNGVTVTIASVADRNKNILLHEFDSETAEYRAAGAWARAKVDEKPGIRIAIIANDLQNAGDSIGRAVREGATPGWQYGHDSLYDAVNVSYGRKLSDYPAIEIAFVCLRWLLQDIRSDEVSLLLRSALVGDADIEKRSQIELELRSVPDREWSPSMITAQFRGRDEDASESDWWTRLTALSKRRREVPQRATPAEWVIFLDESLQALGWPGSGSLGSADFQLINRWRELLNDFARLAVVIPEMNGTTALRRLELLAADTIFQPESEAAAIHLLGPLEAAGAEFDALWICGCSSSNWPPPGSRSLLISRQLQIERDLPDCTPDNTLAYAQQMFARLIASGTEVICSYPRSIEDAEQTASGLLPSGLLKTEPTHPDPGWHALRLNSNGSLESAKDRVPELAVGEKLAGGASAVQRQMVDPVSAFIRSRLYANPLYPQAVGIPPLVRGNLLHDALYRLYVDRQDNHSLAELTDDERHTLVVAAVDGAIARYQRNVDATLRQLLSLESKRLVQLVSQFTAADSERGRFAIASVEAKFEFVHDRVRLPLRIDRLDRDQNGELVVLDYKTGAKKQLLNRQGEPHDVQLFVYAAAIEAPVAAVALVNIDSREISFVGAGRGYVYEQGWSDLLEELKNQIHDACNDLQAGDVRILLEQGVTAARPLNLLTRYTELLRDSR